MARTFEEATAALSPGARWHLACGAWAEAMADNLMRVGFATYCPLVEVMRTPWRRYMSKRQRETAYMFAKPVREPLFPGYFLIGLGGGRDYHDIFRVCRINGLRSVGGKLVPVDDRFVGRMLAIEAGGAIPAKAPLRLLLDVGDLVRLAEGPMAGHVGKVERIADVAIGEIDESVRIWIALDLFGRSNSVQTTLAKVARA